MHQCFFLVFLFRTPFQPCTCRYVFSLYSPPSRTSVRMLFFKEDMTEINFVNYYQSKNHKQRYEWKKTAVQSYQKYVALFNSTGETVMDNFGCLNSSFSLFYFCFVTNLQKKLMTYVRLQMNSPHLPTYMN